MSVFSVDYLEARERFRALADARGCSREVHAIAARGPNGDELTLDVARIGAAQPKRLLALISGIHGVEAPAGSSLQRQLLELDLPGLRLPDDAALLLVHAANPFGYAWSRRWNEDNVDLNRNFLDFAVPRPARPDYAALDAWLNPSELGDPRAFVLRSRELVAERGLPWLQRTLIEGQYEFPRGLYFAGRTPVESNRLLARSFERELGGVERALVIDLHTGMGDYGDCLYLPGHAPGTPRFDWLAERLSRARFVLPTNDDSSPAVPLAGKLSDWLIERHPALVYLTVEFGTVGGERMIAAERAENWLFHYGDRDGPLAAEILREIRETSAPDDPLWRRRVLVQGAALVGDAWRALFGSR